LVPKEFHIGVIIFCLVRFLSKKSNQTEIFFEKKSKPNRNRVKQTSFGLVRFFRAKTGSNRFGLVFLILVGFLGFSSVFSGFGSVFLVWLGFSSLVQYFSDFFVSVWFGFFSFLLIKPKPNRPSRFFQNFNRFN